jgi:hypothetical protein
VRIDCEGKEAPVSTRQYIIIAQGERSRDLGQDRSVGAVAGLTEVSGLTLVVVFSFRNRKQKSQFQPAHTYRKMDKETVQPNSWVAIKLPNETYKVLQVVPNT